MGQTVLVVEDDPKIVNLLGLYLKREGFSVASAADGREAMDAAVRVRPNLIILDLMLPHVDLTPVEFRLLQTLMESPERAFTRDQLLNHIYAHHEAVSIDRAIDVHVGKVRQKLGDDPDRPRFIATVRGVGYKLL